jgi:sugar transferase (PEP-CTERM/EpsH1 system associated)
VSRHDVDARMMTAAEPVTRTDGARTAPLIAHIIHRLDVGGMENGLVNLINHMPASRYRHAIVCMTDSSDFRDNIRRDDVAVYALHKQPGKDLGVHLRLWRLLRTLRPDIVHTRNLGTLETQFTAMLAGVRRRVHGEHGWEISDTDGSNRKNQRLRRLARPLVGEYIALSRHQVDYLRRVIAVGESRLTHICNGVDTDRFHPAPAGRETPMESGFSADTLVVGAVMRMQAVKGPDVLLEAFLQLRERSPEAKRRMRLMMIGDGPLLESLRERVTAAGADAEVWLPGRRSDVAALMRGMDLLVVPSHAEGICNTLLEGMASGLPVIATAVGGNPDLVAEGVSGSLVPAADAAALATALETYLQDPVRMKREGRAARERAERHFSLGVMVDAYMGVYERMLSRR